MASTDRKARNVSETSRVLAVVVDGSVVVVARVLLVVGAAGVGTVS
jgi:hypothetical protein